MTWEEISRELFKEKTSERFTVDSDGKWWDRKSNKYVTIDHLFDLVKELEEENEQLKQQWKEKRHEDINELSVIAMRYKALEKENERLRRCINEIYTIARLEEVD